MNSTFRATASTAYLQDGGRLEVARQMAAHEPSRITELYERRGDGVDIEEVEADWDLMKEMPMTLPAGYADLLADLKQRIQTAQLRASLAVNRELILLYWGIGREILQRQANAGWGSKVIERLARDLRPCRVP